MQQPAATADMCRRIDSVLYRNTCPKCGRQSDYTMEVPEFARDILVGGNTQNFCEECAAEIERLETLRREQMRREQLLNKAAIPADFMQWDKAKGNNVLAQHIRENAGKSLFICGRNDAGKTRAAAINLKLQILNGTQRCRFIRWSDLALGYARTCKLSSENARLYIDSYLKFDILLIDDIGKRRITETAGEMLYDIVDLIYSGSSSVKLWITSNRDLSAFANSFENLDIGDAVVSRLDRMIAAGKMVKIEAGK